MTITLNIYLSTNNELDNCDIIEVKRIYNYVKYPFNSNETSSLIHNIDFISTLNVI